MSLDTWYTHIIWCVNPTSLSLRGHALKKTKCWQNLLCTIKTNLAMPVCIKWQSSMCAHCIYFFCAGVLHHKGYDLCAANLILWSDSTLKGTPWRLTCQTFTTTSIRFSAKWWKKHFRHQQQLLFMDKRHHIWDDSSTTYFKEFGYSGA